MMNMRAHIAERIAAADLIMSPFPHLVISNFFPADVFAKVLEFNPFKDNTGEEWLSKNESREVSSRTPYYARKQINFHKDQRFDAPDNQRVFWDELKDCFLETIGSQN